MTRRPLPEDPIIRSLVQAQTGVSRRSVLAGGVGLAGLGALLAACGTGGTSSPSGTTSASGSPVVDLSDTDKVVDWANWTLYLDYDDKTKTYPTLEAFTAKTGIKVNYVEAIEDNDSYFGKVQGQLANHQDIGEDIITLTDWMAARVIRLGYTQPFDLANIPNAKNLLPDLKNVSFDPGRKNSLTWQSGFAGLAWSKSAVPKGLHSLDDLWAPELAGRVEVLSEMRDTVGLIMLSQGVDISGDTWGDDQFNNALDVLKKYIDNGHIRQVKGNSYAEDLVSKDALAVIGWSGDITVLNFENTPDWEFALPDAGGTLWSDNLMIPVASPHKKNAETLINYYYDPAVAAEVAAYVNYICPVEGAKEAMAGIDPTLVDNQLIFPDESTLAKSHVFRALTADEETRYNKAFQAVIGN